MYFEENVASEMLRMSKWMDVKKVNTEVAQFQLLLDFITETRANEFLKICSQW